MKKFVRFLFTFLNDIKKSNSEVSEINYETDSLRFIFDAYLAEYNSIRREIELQIELQERNINYLLLVIAALFSASQLFGDIASDLISLLNKNPYIYIIFATLSLIFPLTYITRSTMVHTLASYQHYVLSRKINAISIALHAHSEATKEIIKWENNKFPIWLLGPMKWEDYRPKIQFKGNLILFGLLNVFRYIFVSTPSFFFIVVFHLSKENFWISWLWYEHLTYSIFILFVLTFIGGLLFSTSRLLGSQEFDSLKG